MRPSKSATTSRTSATTRSTASASVPRASSQPVARLAMALTPPGDDVHLADGGDAAVRLGGAAGRDDQAARPSIASSRSSRAVVPAWLASPGRSTRQRPCGQMSLPTPTGVAEVAARARPCSTCSSTKVPTRASVSSSRPRCGRVVARRAHRLGHRHAVASASPGPVGVERAGDDPRAGAGDAEPGALLVGEVDDAHRAAGVKPVLAQQVHARRAPHDAERPVEGAAVGHRVEVRADDDAGVPGGDRGVRVTPPGPLVAHPVGREVEASGGALAGEPLPQVVVLAGPGEPVVAPVSASRPTDSRSCHIRRNAERPRRRALASWSWVFTTAGPSGRRRGMVSSRVRRWGRCASDRRGRP